MAVQLEVAHFISNMFGLSSCMVKGEQADALVHAH